MPRACTPRLTAKGAGRKILEEQDLVLLGGPTMPKIELSLPATSEYLGLVRFHVGSAAMLIDLSIDEVQDLQIAIEELCLSLLRPWGREQARLRLDIEWGHEAVEVSCHLIDASLVRAPAPGSEGLPHHISQQILDTLTDEHGTSVSDGVQIAWLRKRRHPR